MNTAKQYHEATKYSIETIAKHPGLDWSTQPKPFKTFRSKTRISLAEHLLVERDVASGRPALAQPEVPFGQLGIEQLSTLLLHSYGVTAVAQMRAGNHYFRAAPSAGALYPTELYLATSGVEGIPDGIYDYQTQEHCLAPVLEGDYSAEIRALCPEGALAPSTQCFIIVSCVYYRSSWRYHDRAYRRILLDTGHALGNIALSAPELDISTEFVGGFDDQALNSMLWLDDSQEATLALVGLELGHQLSSSCSPSPALDSESASDDSDPSLLRQLHRAGYITKSALTITPKADPSLNQVAAGRSPIQLSQKPFAWPDPVCETILLRRSTRQFGGGPMPLEELAMILEFGYRPLGPQGEEHGLFAPEELKDYVSIQNVSGLESGLYRYSRQRHQLDLIRAGEFSARCGEIALGQDLAHDAAVVLFHTADLAHNFERFGDRGYRYLSLDAGHIGERLNLAAIRMGLGVSGIGGYFDDQINELLELPAAEAIVYMTCFGQPLLDI